MEQKESQYLALGRVYAAALYDVARKGGQLEAVQADIEAIRALFNAAPRLDMFLKASIINTAEKWKLLEPAISESIHALTMSLLGAMARRDRLDILREFTLAFAIIQQERNNRLHIDIISAQPLPEPEQKRIAEAAGRSFDRNIDLTTSVDGSLVGGIQLKIGDMLIDGSVQRRLRNMRAYLHRSILAGLGKAKLVET
jgi:F-type H+-transporting ATPase subunit delta